MTHYESADSFADGRRQTVPALHRGGGSRGVARALVARRLGADAFLPEPDVGQRIENPRDVAEIWKGELDARRKTNSLCVLTCHPFLSGRPSRLGAIEDFKEFAGRCSDVRSSRADRLADLVLGDSEDGA